MGAMLRGAGSTVKKAIILAFSLGSCRAPTAVGEGPSAAAPPTEATVVRASPSPLGGPAIEELALPDGRRLFVGRSPGAGVLVLGVFFVGARAARVARRELAAVAEGPAHDALEDVGGRVRLLAEAELAGAVLTLPAAPGALELALGPFAADAMSEAPLPAPEVDPPFGAIVARHLFASTSTLAAYLAESVAPPADDGLASRIGLPATIAGVEPRELAIVVLGPVDRSAAVATVARRLPARGPPLAGRPRPRRSGLFRPRAEWVETTIPDPTPTSPDGDARGFVSVAWALPAADHPDQPTLDLVSALAARRLAPHDAAVRLVRFARAGYLGVHVPLVKSLTTTAAVALAERAVFEAPSGDELLGAHDEAFGHRAALPRHLDTWAETLGRALARTGSVSAALRPTPAPSELTAAAIARVVGRRLGKDRRLVVVGRVAPPERP